MNSFFYLSVIDGEHPHLCVQTDQLRLGRGVPLNQTSDVLLSENLERHNNRMCLILIKVWQIKMFIFRQLTTHITKSCRPHFPE